MENQHISGLFQKIKARIQKQTVDCEGIIQAIFLETKIRLPEKDIHFKKGILTLNISPLKKNEIRIKKEAILARIASLAGVTVTDIR